MRASFFIILSGLAFSLASPVAEAATDVTDLSPETHAIR